MTLLVMFIFKIFIWNYVYESSIMLFLNALVYVITSSWSENWYPHVFYIFREQTVSTFLVKILKCEEAVEPLLLKCAFNLHEPLNFINIEYFNNFHRNMDIKLFFWTQRRRNKVPVAVFIWSHKSAILKKISSDRNVPRVTSKG